MPDLTEIPGLPELWMQTQGTPRITIIVLDGSVDLERACFQGANLTKIHPYWQDTIADIDPQYLQAFLAIENSKDDDQTKASRLKTAIPDAQIIYRLFFAFHATHISSTIFGQPGSPVEGIAPHCRGINIPLDVSGIEGKFIAPMNLTRAFNLALEKGAHIIHCAACHPTQTGAANELLSRAIRQCQENNILVIAPGGNDQGECWCIPAVLPDVLAVGAMKDNGHPFKFSNWGGKYQTQGVLAPGENILGAQPGTDEPVRKKGTSCAAPIVTGVAALLLSLQLKRGEQPDPEAVRAAILNSAITCNPEEIEEPERCLLGKLNIPGAVKLLTGESLATMAASGDKLVIPSNVATSITTSQPTDGITPSARSNLVYFLGNLGYDLSNEARRDSFKQLMPNVRSDTFEPITEADLPLPDGVVAVPPNPYDPRQMVKYLENNPSEAKSLIWTLNLELDPVYAIEPHEAFADDVYETLQQLFAEQLEAEDSEDYIERVSIPGRLTTQSVQLFSGQVVEVVELYNKRGLCGWSVNRLINHVIEMFSQQMEVFDDDQEAKFRQFLDNFLNRIYNDFQNLGQISRDRALNFAATNVYQLAQVFIEAVKQDMELDSIEMEKSPFSRPDSDCWSVKLKFFDPENNRRAKKLFRYTIDVNDIMPVTLGQVRSWSTLN